MTTSMRRALLVGAMLAAAASVFSWRAARTAGAGPIGVVLVTLDTTRADRLSPYGFMDVAMPHLDRLAREGVVFDRARSAAPLTLPAHTSLMTGLVPPGHGVIDNASPALADGHTTLAELLRERGFRTAAFVGSAVLGSSRGLAQGFETYGDIARDNATSALRGQRRGNEVMNDAIAWLDGLGTDRFFLWTHLYDPHRPYDPPEPYRTRHFDPYVGEILFADAQLGRLIEALERRQRLDRTIVIVTSDHGESLGEHGERDHGVFVYDSVLRVPLIVRAPGLPPGRTAALVRLTDVFPTILDLLELPEFRTDGVSLLPHARGERSNLDLEAYAESRYPERFGWSPLFALADVRYKLIEAPRPELYDLRRDPFEEHNVYQQLPAVARAMRARLETIRARAPAGSSPSGSTNLLSDQRERLAALGYASGGRPPSGGASRPDPKDCIAKLESLPDFSSAMTGRLLLCK
jgi:arylsulfatase A-like enzyme